MDDFKLIVAGSRDFTDYKLLCKEIDYYISKIKTDHNVVIISGHARGADKLGEQYAKEHGYPCMIYEADWSKGRSAGFVRNKKMAKIGHALIAFWDGKSAGTANMIDQMKMLGKQFKVINYGNNPNKE